MSNTNKGQLLEHTTEFYGGCPNKGCPVKDFNKTKGVCPCMKPSTDKKINTDDDRKLFMDDGKAGQSGEKTSGENKEVAQK